MNKSKHIVIIAGEESGDIHASVLIKQLQAANPELKISGIGGAHMQNAGATLIYDLAQYGVTGLTEVVAYLGIIHKAFNLIKQHLRETKPDLLILVDYPGFNLRLARYAKKRLGLKILYYISPQIWAWKAKRIHLIKACVDHMAVILPFEKKLYEKNQVPVSFVGHPLVEKINTLKSTFATREALSLPADKKIVALLPGSRTHEIERHMPILFQTAELIHKHYPELHFAIPIASTIKPMTIKRYFLKSNLPITFIDGYALDCMAASDFVFVASGTASLECALLEKPMCILYKSSLITYHVAMKLIKVRFLGLCNLLAERMIVPEFLQYDCNPTELFKYFSGLMDDPLKPRAMINQLSLLKDNLSNNMSDCSLIELVRAQVFELNQ